MVKITSLLGVTLALCAFTAAGATIALPDGVPAWSFSGDASVATLTPSADGKSATLVPHGAAGSVSVSVTLAGFTKVDTFQFDAVVVQPPAPPAVASIDWTVTDIAAAASPAPVPNPAPAMPGGTATS